MMDLISWPVVLSILASAGILLVVALFYHAGRRVGALEVLNMIKFRLSTTPSDQKGPLYALSKEIRDEYELD